MRLCLLLQRAAATRGGSGDGSGRRGDVYETEERYITIIKYSGLERQEEGRRETAGGIGLSCLRWRSTAAGCWLTGVMLARWPSACSKASKRRCAGKLPALPACLRACCPRVVLRARLLPTAPISKAHPPASNSHVYRPYRPTCLVFADLPASSHARSCRHPQLNPSPSCELPSTVQACTACTPTIDYLR